MIQVTILDKAPQRPTESIGSIPVGTAFICEKIGDHTVKDEVFLMINSARDRIGKRAIGLSKNIAFFADNWPVYGYAEVDLSIQAIVK